MRQSHASLALVRRAAGGRQLYLTQWNEKWNAFSLVGGHRDGEESYLDCLRRELREELGLDPGRDCLVGPSRRLRYVAFSQSAGEDTEYTVELYEVELPSDVAERVGADERNAWLTAEEIRAGRRESDGRAVSATVREILDRIDRAG